MKHEEQAIWWNYMAVNQSCKTMFGFEVIHIKYKKKNNVKWYIGQVEISIHCPM
jgi:hypothetical protein